MKNKIIIFASALFLLLACTLAIGLFYQQSMKTSDPYNFKHDSTMIPTKNYCWPKDATEMIQVGSYIYYVGTTEGNGVAIKKMFPDGTGKVTITKKYFGIGGIASDATHIYYVTFDKEYRNFIRAVPVSGGTERLVFKGKEEASFQDLRAVNGQLYFSTWGNRRHCYSIDLQGQNKSEILKANRPIQILFTENEIYFTEVKDFYADIFRSDLNGEHVEKLSANRIFGYPLLFFDQGNLYFVTDSDESGWPMYSNFYKLNPDGSKSLLLKDVGYYGQDYGIVQFCAVSGGDFYHFKIMDNDEDCPSELRRFNIANQVDSVILQDNLVFTEKFEMRSARGKVLADCAARGLYIVGDDVYYRSWVLP